MRWVTRYNSWKLSTDVAGVKTSRRPTTCQRGGRGEGREKEQKSNKLFFQVTLAIANEKLHTRL